ncbi:SDR family oxidoreductase [Streptomyces sp. NBC_01764]|nr:SDR family oxidoreductase [Streptomyces sp. NBC_01764]MCX4405897.1 SDR family oxidoreductase [Streptomyces sp. NBC_01764]
MPRRDAAMTAAGYGRIVSIGSTTGTVNAMPGQATYTAAKAGLVGLSRALALETVGNGVTVNVVAPGYVTTGSQLEFEAAAAAAGPFGRSGTPDEIAACVLFLAHESHRSSPDRCWSPTAGTVFPRPGRALDDAGVGRDPARSVRGTRPLLYVIRRNIGFGMDQCLIGHQQSEDRLLEAGELRMRSTRWSRVVAVNDKWQVSPASSRIILSACCQAESEEKSHQRHVMSYRTACPASTYPSRSTHSPAAPSSWAWGPTQILVRFRRCR